MNDSEVTHDCSQCTIRHCTRHPSTVKVAGLKQICSGLRGPELQQRYMALWDEQEGISTRQSQPVPHGPVSFVRPTQPAADQVAAKPASTPKASSGCCGRSTVASTIGTSFITFGASMAKWAWNGFPVVPEVIANKRRSICDSCPIKKTNAIGDYCAECNCIIKAKVQLPHEQCPLGKWIQWTPTSREFADEPRRHLIYHLWPTTTCGAWRWNVAQLLKRIDMFDGVRSIAIVVDDKTDTLATVQSAFAGHRIDNWIELPNNSQQREGVTFHPLLDTLPNDGVTFYGHGKGVRHHDGSLTIRWAEMMYRTMLDDWPSVRFGLESFPMVGSFKRYGPFQHLKNNHHWHYSGTFYWFRNADILAHPNHRNLARNFFACVEAWPANMYESHECGCLFADDVGDLYKEHELSRWAAKLARWNQARS